MTDLFEIYGERARLRYEELARLGWNGAEIALMMPSEIDDILARQLRPIPLED